MIETLIVAARDRERLSEVFAIAARFGLDGLLSRIGLRQDGGEAEAADLPTRTRRALEALGPTYIKLGQILATRRDLLPYEWIRALEHLQSGAPSLPFEALRDQVEASLGEPVTTAFAAFDPAPLAAASIAQVHRARLHDDTQIVVKIRRPGIRQRMEADLRLIRHLAGLAEANSAEARRFKPRALVDQLARDILDELDFTREGRNADLLRADLSANTRVVVPAIHWQWSTEDLLVMDYIEGIAPRDPEALREGGIDPARIAELGAELVFDMVLVNGRFHGDPHPGNLLCLPGDRLALLDLGSVGFVSPRRQHEFLTFISGLRSGDPGAVADMLALWSREAQVPRERILAAAERLVARHGSGPLVLNAMVADFFPLLRHEGLVLPPDLLLIFKAMVTMDGVLAQIEPGFDLSGALQAVRGKLVVERIARFTGPDRTQAMLLELSRIAEEAPHFLRSAAEWIDRQRDAEPSDGMDRADGVDRAIRMAGWVIGGAILLHALAPFLT
ncbi:MAG: ABC1 kinase family protein [Sphingobium sp.]